MIRARNLTRARTYMARTTIAYATGGGGVNGEQRGGRGSVIVPIKLNLNLILLYLKLRICPIESSFFMGLISWGYPFKRKTFDKKR
jgi:hypothetical protein